MNRTILLLAVFAVAAGFHEWKTPPAGAHALIPHTGTCADSFPADGHPGPWHTTGNGGTEHANTVSVDCDNPTSHWDIKYCLQVKNPNLTFSNVFCDERMGNGSPGDFSESISPRPCTFLGYRTHVENLVTGGTTNKPGQGNTTLDC